MMVRNDYTGNHECDLDLASECFAEFSSANGFNGRAELPDGSLSVCIESPECAGLSDLFECVPKPARWAASSALAEGRIAVLSCREVKKGESGC